MKASEFSSGEKRMLLEQIRRQVGESAYNRMVDECGEDGLVDAVLYSLEHPSPPGRHSEGPWQKSWDQFAGLIVALAISGSLSGGWAGLLGGVAAALLWLVGGAFYYWLRSFALVNRLMAWLLGALGILAAGMGVGLAVRYGGPWLVKGVHQWWSWLAGHF